MKHKKKFKKIMKRLSKQKRQLNNKYNLKRESLVKIERTKESKTRQFYNKKSNNKQILLI